MNHTSVSFTLGECCKSSGNEDESSQSLKLCLKAKNISYPTQVLTKLQHVNTSILPQKKNIIFSIYSPDSCLKTSGLLFISVRRGLDFRSIWWISHLKIEDHKSTKNVNLLGKQC